MVEVRTRLNSLWRRARRRRCPSRAPVEILDGLEVRHLYRWSPRCELPRGHDGPHRAGAEHWTEPVPRP